MPPPACTYATPSAKCGSHISMSFTDARYASTASARRSDPLMGWTQSSDMNGQVRLNFETRDEAVAYAQRHEIPFQLFEPKTPKRIIKAYADNFAAGRMQPWTH